MRIISKLTLNASGFTILPTSYVIFFHPQQCFTLSINDSSLKSNIFTTNNSDALNFANLLSFTFNRYSFVIESFCFLQLQKISITSFPNIICFK